MDKQTYIKNLIESHPVCKSGRNGRWGWQTVNGGLDLRTCRFRTEKSATDNRNHAALINWEVDGSKCRFCGDNGLSTDPETAVQGLCDHCNRQIGEI